MNAAASTADILRAVERWARVRGWYRLDSDAVKARWHNRGPWCVEVVDAEVRVWTQAMRGAPMFYIRPALALAWALLVERGAASVDVGRCPACQGQGTETRIIKGQGRLWANGVQWNYEHDGWSTAVARVDGEHVVTARQPCPVCSGTGRETIPAERLLLDAASGDAQAFTRLDYHAECKLRDRGDPLGELLAWALRLWTGEPTDCGECPACHGRKRRMIRSHPGLSGTTAPYMDECPTCSGSGRQLGHPHTADAVRWLEWLTWAREFGKAGALKRLAAQAVESVLPPPPRTIDPEALALSQASVLTYEQALTVIRAADAVGATVDERCTLGPAGLIQLARAYHGGALAGTIRPL